MANPLRWYPLNEAYSRQQVQAITGISDDVLGFWIKQGLLIPKPAEARAHRRFGYEQIHVAAVLQALRSLGPNVSVLRAFADAIQHGIELASSSGLTYDQLRLGVYLARSLNRYRRGEECIVLDAAWWDDRSIVDSAKYDRAAVNEEDIIQDWFRTNKNERVLDRSVADFFSGLSDQDNRHLDMWLELTSPEHIANHYSSVWVAWVDDQGQAQVISGEDVSPHGHVSPPVAAFYIALSTIIRRLWPDRWEAARLGRKADMEEKMRANLRELAETDPAEAERRARKWNITL